VSGEGTETLPEPERERRVGAGAGARRAAVLGGGVIGGGWAARFLLSGWDVALHDPDPEAERRVGEVVANARASLPALSDLPMPLEGRLTVAGSVGEAVAGADWVQESVPERLELKHRLIAAVQEAAPEAAIGSSTSGFRPSQLQEGAREPSRILVAHPFNPVYLLPLVEVVPSVATAAEVVQRAKEVFAGLGMYPLHVRREIDAHLADRFLEAVWREALWLVKDGVATTGEIDEAIRMGFGLRWAQMGLFETYRIAGGEAGMRHFLAQFGPCLTWPWTRLTDVPELDEALVETIAAQSDEQAGGRSIRDLERMRDSNLVGILRALKDRDQGAGRVLNAADRARRAAFVAEPDSALEAVRMEVLPSWIDYNGHMTESRYLFAASETTDAFLRAIGCDLDYVATGFSYYTAETHILHKGEARVGDRLAGTVQVLHADDKRLHVFVRILKGEVAVASLEQMLLHVDARAGRVCAAPEAILGRLRPIAEAHAVMPRPEGAGRYVGQRA
jgi:carnitine 3-dehydrogenase